MKVSERIAKLRALMAEKGIDAYVVPTADFHQSEYVGEHFKARKYITGFSGSYGTAVICQDDAGLWTDGRYFFQATNELEGSGVRLMKMFVGDTPSVTEYLADKIPEGGKVGFDGRVLSMDEGKEYEDALSPKNISIDYEEDLIDQIWEDRPPLSDKPAFFLDEKYSGESSAHKLERVRKIMKDNGATVHIIASLDDTGWLLNVRGDDIDFFPLLLSYSIVRMDGVDLYVDETKLNDRILEEFKKVNVTLHPYNDIYEDIKKLDASETALIDPMKMNYALYKNIPCKIVEAANPTILMKAMKNDVELENIKEAHIKDGIAITKFMYWIKTRYDKEDITELSSADKLTSLRAAQEGYIRDSFEPLCAFADHAAMMHYSATEESNYKLEPRDLFLVDSGGQYFDGTTDITRTFALGELTEEEKYHFTTVARAMIRLSDVKFLHGVNGYYLDILARGILWNEGLNYNHGTGHGVGHVLNVHEGPNGFRLDNKESAILEEGMITTNEPGFYKAGSHGIRLENEMLCVKGEKNEFGQFMEFEPITIAPIDLDAINVELMKEDEKAYLNEYHKMVFDTVSPFLTTEETNWLKEYTRAI